MQPRSHFFRTGCRWTIPSAALLLSLLLAAASASAQTVTTIFDFNGAKGSNPFLETLTQGRDGKLYGTTYTGGASDLGTVFRLDPSIGREVVIHSFDEPNGSNPGGGLTLASAATIWGRPNTVEERVTVCCTK